MKAQPPALIPSGNSLLKTDPFPPALEVLPGDKVGQKHPNTEEMRDVEIHLRVEPQVIVSKVTDSLTVPPGDTARYRILSP